MFNTPSHLLLVTLPKTLLLTMASITSELYEQQQQKKRPSKTLKSKQNANNPDINLSYSTRSLQKWLKENNLSHLHNIIASSHISIEDLSQCNQIIIRDTAYYKLKLRGKDLLSFVHALIRYNNLQCLTTRSNEVLARINNLEFAVHELDINQRNDIQYIQHKIQKLVKTLKKREGILIEQMNKSYLHKKESINEQIHSLHEYNDKLLQQKRLLLDECDMNKKIKVDQNMNCKVLLNETTNFSKNKANKSTKISVEMPNYDDLMSSIKRTGIITDDEKDDAENQNALQCLCGSELVLTNVAQCYDERLRDKIYCNFCKYHCALPDDGEIYHCPSKDIKTHPGGFDLCFFCAAKCIEARKVDKKRNRDRMREEKRRKKMQKMLAMKNEQTYSRKTIDLGKSAPAAVQYTRKRPNAHHVISPLVPKTRHQRSQSAVVSEEWFDSVKDTEYVDGFMYVSEVQRLVSMGYDYVRARKSVIKYEGDMTKVMQELLT